MKVLIIADDFTGALDTGVQFAKRGIETQVIAEQNLSKHIVSQTAQVVVVDSETRGLEAKVAYLRVKEIVESALLIGVSTIFKKTDSALRGNVGAELEAVLDGTKENEICFIPAFPAMNRVTRNGVHYIDGKLLTDSVFAKDPFEPVVHSDISEIIKSQSECDVQVIEKNKEFLPKSTLRKRIYVFDAESNKDIYNRTEELKKLGKLKVIAGCAGFAEHLSKALQIEMGKAPELKKTQGLYVACGSLNSITKEQVETAALHNYHRINLAPKQKLCKQYHDTLEGKEFLQDINTICKNEPIVIVDTFDLSEEDTTLNYAKSLGLSKEDIRHNISSCHGRIVRYLLENGLEHTLLMTGGDTLMGVMKALKGGKLHPICEIDKGIVVSNLVWNYKSIQVISKSGGFGHKEIIKDIASKIMKEVEKR